MTARTGAPAKPGEVRGGAAARPAQNRPQIKLDDVTRDLFERRLEALPLDRDGLKLAMRQFGSSFDLEQFRAARDGRDIAKRNQARLVTSNFQALTDGMVELVREAATVTGLRAAQRSLTVNPDIEAVRADGGLKGSQADKLIRLKKLANDLRHIYIKVDAESVHAGVEQVLNLLPAFTASFLTWLAEYGITFA